MARVSLLGSRTAVWTSIALGIVSALLLPYLDTWPCHLQDSLYAAEGPVGGRTAWCLAGALWAVFLDPHGRVNWKCQLHLWAWRYAVAVALQGGFLVLYSWLIVACLGNTAVFLGIVVGAATLTYCVSQGILCYVTLLRLRIVAPGAAATRAGRLFHVMLCGGAQYGGWPFVQV